MRGRISFLLLLAALSLKAQDPDSLKYQDASCFMLLGKGFDQTEGPYDRLPAALKNTVRPTLWTRSKNCAGMALRFRSKTSNLGVRWEVTNEKKQNHMAPTGVRGLDLYVLQGEKWRFLSTARPGKNKSEYLLVSNMPEEYREYMLYLPLYAGLVSLEIGCDPEAELTRPETLLPVGRPIVFYGTSITQGGCASRPGMAYPAMVQRDLNRETINLGFSGQGKLDWEILEAMLEIDASCYVVDCLANCTPELVKERGLGFIRRLLEQKPGIPIVMVEEVGFAQGFLDPTRKSPVVAKNALWKSIYTELKTSYPNLHYLAADGLIGNDFEATVDGRHFTDLGFTRFAAAMSGILRPLLPGPGPGPKGQSSQGSQFITHSNTDPRLVANGSEIPSRTYADQPYVIVCDDGSWLAVMTTSAGTEYAYMNHIISTKSYDQGKTWSPPVEVEPPAPPQSAWAVPLKVPGGRIYVFYNYNRDGYTGVEGVMSGPFMFKYSDDHGRTWSSERYEAPIRRTRIDKENYTGGKTCFFWSIDKPVVTDQAAYITFSKIFRETAGQAAFYLWSEGFILKSENILYESRPEKIRWTTLPEGETGIVNPGFGHVQAEHNSVVLNNGDLYVVYRTIDGFPVFATSSDGGKSFSQPAPMSYASGGIMGNPRACPKIHKTLDGKYLFWYHNNFRKNSYNGRNPVWLSGGIEKEGRILWSQPEIILYDEDTQLLGMSYPDFIEQDGQLWLSETQKNKARIHQMDPKLIEGLWKQFTRAGVCRRGLVMETEKEQPLTGRINFPSLPSLAGGGGFTLELWMEAASLEEGQEILSTMGTTHRGIRVLLTGEKSIGIQIGDGELRENKLQAQTFRSDAGSLEAGKKHHVVFIVDGAAKIVSVIVDGVLSDGDLETRPYGWGRLYPHLGDLNGSLSCELAPGFDGKVSQLRVYNRYLTSSEAIANYRAGLEKQERE